MWGGSGEGQGQERKKGVRKKGGGRGGEARREGACKAGVWKYDCDSTKTEKVTQTGAFNRIISLTALI